MHFRPSHRYGDNRDDELEESQTLQNGIFAVLYTLLGRRYDNSKRVVALRLVIEFLQVFTLVVSPHFGWAIDTDLWCAPLRTWHGRVLCRLNFPVLYCIMGCSTCLSAGCAARRVWKAVAWLDFEKALQGYSTYTTVLYCLVALTATCLIGCAWLFWRAKHGKTGFQW